MNLLPKILWQQQSKWQIIAASVGAFIGLLLLLLAVQLQRDIHNLMNGSQSAEQQYVLINKQVSLLNTLGIKAAFVPAEIESIKSQSFISSVGSFTANRFKVSASSPTLGFYTELFFEAVPDEFIDIEDDFSWKKDSKIYLLLFLETTWPCIILGLRLVRAYLNLHLIPFNGLPWISL